MQLNKDIQKTDLPKKEKSNTDLSNTDSIPIHSLNPLPYDGEAAEPPERKRTEAAQSAFEIYEEIIKDNISYDVLVQDRQLDRERLDELVDLMLETVCTRRKTIRVAGDDYPAELVKAVHESSSFQCPVHYRQLLHVACGSRHGKRLTLPERAGA